MYLQWYLELLSCSCGFDSRREHQFKVVMIEKVITAFFVEKFLAISYKSVMDKH